MLEQFVLVLARQRAYRESGDSARSLESSLVNREVREWKRELLRHVRPMALLETPEPENDSVLEPVRAHIRDEVRQDLQDLLDGGTSEELQIVAEMMRYWKANRSGEQTGVTLLSAMGFVFNRKRESRNYRILPSAHQAAVDALLESLEAIELRAQRNAAA